MKAKTKPALVARPRLMRKLSARTRRVFELGPEGWYRDHAQGCRHFVGEGGAAGCDPKGAPVIGCSIGEALFRLANLNDRVRRVLV